MILHENDRVFRSQGRGSLVSFLFLNMIKSLLINSSLNESLENLKVLRLYKIVITLESFPNDFRGWIPVRPTICDQAQVDRTLRSGVRAQNEGKFELFVVTSTLT